MLPLRAAALLAVLLLSSSARAQTPDVSLRAPSRDVPAAPPAGPDHGKMATEEATPVGDGAIEVEFAYGPTLTHRGSGDFDRSAHAHAHAYTLGVFYGVTEHLDVKVAGGFGYAVDQADVAGPTRGSGMTDLALGSRWRFLALGERALDLTLATTVVAPTGLEATATSLGFTQGYWSLRNALVASKDWGRATANAEVALTLPVSGGAAGFRSLTCANLAFGYALVSWFQPIVEANYDLGLDDHTHQRLALTGGVNMTAQSGARLLLGVQQSVWGRDVPQTTTGLVAVKAAF